MGTIKDCMIVGAGEVSRKTLARCAAMNECFIIAADGGYLRCEELGLTPDLILGDFDSAPMPKDGITTKVFAVHKDDTDCMLAVKEGLERGYRRFTILGGTGGRLDHTLANIQTLVWLSNRGCTARLLDERHQMSVITGDISVRVEGSRSDYLSLFSMGDRCTGVTLRNVEYPLHFATLENSFPVGVSNRFLGDWCTVEMKAGTMLIMIVQEEAPNE